MAKKQKKKTNKKKQVVNSTKEVKKETVVEKKETVVKKEKVEEKTLFEKIMSNKIVDVLLIILAINVLLFAHHYAFDIDPEDPSQIYYYTDDGLPHLFDMDSYYYTRKTREFVTGEQKKIITTRSEDKYQTNTSDRDDSRYTLLLSKIVSIIYKVVKVFKNVNFNRVALYSSAVLSTLVAIPSYIFIKRRTNRVGAFFAAVLSGLSISFFSHWAYGCFDTDVLLYTIPLMYVGSFIECLVETDKKKRYIWLAISAISFILLMLTWDVFGVYYFLVLGVSLLLFVITLIRNKFDFKNVIKLPEIIMIFVTNVVYTILSFIVNKGIDASILKDILSVLKPAEAGNMNYPNPGAFTSELAKIDLIDLTGKYSPFEATTGSLVNRLGGFFICALFVLGVILLIIDIVYYRKHKNEEDKSKYIVGIILIIWAIGGLLSTNMGSRFVKIATIPVNLIAAYSVGVIYKNAEKKGFKYATILLSVAFLVSPFMGAKNVASTMYHSATDSLVETADYIKKHSNENDVVATWWDYGYLFEYQAERRAIADGGTYNGRYVYYLANAMASESETASANMFKMLADSGVTVTYLTDEYLGNPKKGNEALLDALKQETREGSKKLLMDKYNLSDEQATKVSSYTHPDLDYKVIFVVTESMLRMRKAINYFAHYDFETGVETQSELKPTSIYLRLYEFNSDSKHFKHLYRSTDPTQRLSTNVFVIE